MEQVKVTAISRNSGKQSFLPPKSPYPSTVAPVHTDYASTGIRCAFKLGEGNRYHQRTSSESLLIEDQPSWLDDLLNEPETPASSSRGVHRRSSSDSFTCMDRSYAYSNMDTLGQRDYRGRTVTSIPSWTSQDFDRLKDIHHLHSEGISFNGNYIDREQDSVLESALNLDNYHKSVSVPKEKNMHPSSFFAVSKELDEVLSCDVEKQKQLTLFQDYKNCLENDVSLVMNFQSDSDAKRVKQQFAQRSRVRKLQYIAELERSVQVFQAEQMEVSADLEFVDQQNLILSLENKALKQRLDCLVQEHLVKCLQQEMLEQEIARLRLLFQHQKQPLEATPQSRSNSIRELDSQFANLSVKKHTVGNSARDTGRM